MCKFPLFEKLEVNGNRCHPVYAFLRSNCEDFYDEMGVKVVPWNFSKFFVKDGKVIK